MSNPYLASLRSALDGVVRLSYCDGSLADVFANEPSFAKLFYQVGDQAGYVDFSKSPSEESLKALADACHTSTFGVKDQDVFNEEHRTAGQLDTTQFCTYLCPKSLGIIDLVAPDLNRSKTIADKIEAKPHKLNVYGPGFSLKPQVETPLVAASNFIGTLVLVLPTKHEGGELGFDHAGQKWVFDSGKALSGDKQGIAYVAFAGDIQHEVLPVTSGYRVTLTFNLFERKKTAKVVQTNQVVSRNDYPGLANMRESLVNLLKDQSFLPEGGFIGFGLSHPYNFNVYSELNDIKKRLRGPDALLKDICNEIGIDVSLKALYCRDEEPDFCLMDQFISQFDARTDVDIPFQLINRRRNPGIYCQDPERTGEPQDDHGNAIFTPLFWVKKPSKKTNVIQFQSLDEKPSWGKLYGAACLVARVVPASERLSADVLVHGKRQRSASTSDRTGKIAKRFKPTKYKPKYKIISPWAEDSESESHKSDSDSASSDSDSD